MIENQKPQNIIKKYRILIVAALAFAVALCCILAFAGNSSDDDTISALSSESASVALISGEGIYVDGNFVAAVSEREDAEFALNSVLNARVAALGIESECENSFVNDVQIISGEYPESAFAEVDKIVSLFGKVSKFNTNAKVTDYSGNVLPIQLSVRSVATYTEDVIIEHETKTVYTDAMRDGVKNVVTQGFDGAGERTYKVISVDGKVSSEEFVSLDVTVPPIEEVVRVGSRSNGKEVASLGTFVKPYDGMITSYFGARWGRNHDGLDIWTNDCAGKPAYAASNGVVVRADVYGGYGNCVIIDHGNGVRTLYAHLSSISVKVGDTLVAGDEIGRIGNTGASQGAHLHFEVHLDGEKVNPLIFVEY